MSHQAKLNQTEGFVITVILAFQLVIQARNTYSSFRSWIFPAVQLARSAEYANYISAEE